MAYNGSGGFIINSTGQPVQTNTIISSSVFNALTADLATGLSTAVTRDGQSPATANLPMGGFKHTGVANGSAATDYAAFGQLISSLGSLTGFIGGLKLSTAGGTGTFGIAAGSATDTTGVRNLPLASAFTKTTASWALGTGNGALDTGSIAINTWYTAFIIGDPTLAPDILFSLSSSAPTLPAGYTLKRRIGAMKTDGSSHWIQFTQINNHFLWTVPPNDVSGVTVSTTAVLHTLSIPPGVVVNVQVRYQTDATASQTLISSPNITDAVPGVPSANVSYQQGGAGFNGEFFIDSNTAQQIRSRATSSTNVGIVTVGWSEYF